MIPTEKTRPLIWFLCYCFNVWLILIYIVYICIICIIITETINHETVYHGNDVRRFDSRYFSKKPRFGFFDQEIFEPSVWLLNYVSKWLPTIPNRARLYFPLRVTLLQSKDLHFIQVMLMHWFFSRKTWSCNKLNILRMLNSVRN